MRGRSASAITPGSAEDHSPTGFRLRHWMSRSKYHRDKKEGRGPKETWYGPRTVIITPEDEAAYDRARANPDATERRLLAKMQAKRIAKAKKAAAVSLASPRHVSKTRKTATRSQ
jgi:hypothetical protein